MRLRWLLNGFRAGGCCALVFSYDSTGFLIRAPVDSANKHAMALLYSENRFDQHFVDLGIAWLPGVQDPAARLLAAGKFPRTLRDRGCSTQEGPRARRLHVAYLDSGSGR